MFEEERSAWQRAVDLYTEAGMAPKLAAVYADALLALRDTENASKLRQAGYEEGAALLQPDPDLIDAAWGDDQRRR